MSPNVLGQVTEFFQERDQETLEPKVQFKLRVRNTLGEERVFWVDGPPELADFFSADRKVEP